MDTDETKLVNGRTITARDVPGRPGEGGCYRHYEVDGGERFPTLEEAEACANGNKPPDATVIAETDPAPADLPSHEPEGDGPEIHADAPASEGPHVD